MCRRLGDGNSLVAVACMTPVACMTSVAHRGSSWLILIFATLFLEQRLVAEEFVAQKMVVMLSKPVRLVADVFQ